MDRVLAKLAQKHSLVKAKNAAAGKFDGSNFGATSSLGAAWNTYLWK